MKQRLITPKEKALIVEYLENRTSSSAIRMLRHRAKKFLPKIKDEITLLEKILIK